MAITQMPQGGGTGMRRVTIRTRKFFGTIVLLAVLVVYTGLAVALHNALIVGWPMVLQLVYFAIAGLGWTLPAMAVIRWMARPD